MFLRANGDVSDLVSNKNIAAITKQLLGGIIASAACRRIWRISFSHPSTVVQTFIYLSHLIGLCIISGALLFTNIYYL